MWLNVYGCNKLQFYAYLNTYIMLYLYCHYGRVGISAVPMIRRTWVRILAKSVIVGPWAHPFPLPLHTKEVENGTVRAVMALSVDQF